MTDSDNTERHPVSVGIAWFLVAVVVFLLAGWTVRAWVWLFDHSWGWL